MWQAYIYALNVAIWFYYIIICDIMLHIFLKKNKKNSSQHQLLKGLQPLRLFIGCQTSEQVQVCKLQLFRVL